MLDKLIELIFEKAINEQTFAYMYADMCAILESQKPFWEFLQIVHNMETNQYFWTADFAVMAVEGTTLGPFGSYAQCVAALGLELPQGGASLAVPIPITEPEDNEVYLLSGKLVQVLSLSLLNCVIKSLMPMPFPIPPRTYRKDILYG